MANFNESEYGALKNEFYLSILVFGLVPHREKLATQLKNHNIKMTVCQGSAINKVDLSAPFVSSKSRMSKMLSNVERFAWKQLQLEPAIVEVPTLPDEEEKDESEEVNKYENLMLFDPSKNYKVNSGDLKELSNKDWVAFSTLNLNKRFLWVVKLVSDVIEEHPKELYFEFSRLESLIFLENGRLTHTLVKDKKLLKHRLVSAKKSEL